VATQVVTIVVRQVGAQATAAAIRNVGQQSRAAAASVRIFGAALTAIVAGGTIASLFRLQDVYTRVGNQLRFATASQEEFRAVAQAVLQVANDTRAPLEDTALLYRRLQAATKAFGVSQSDVLKVVSGLNAAILVSGANAQEARGGLTQFTQALQSGRLAGDELRSLLENITPLAESVARNLGLSLGQLRAQAKDIPVDVLFAAVQKSADEFNSKLKDVEFSASQTFNIFRNNLLVALDVLDQAVGGTEGINEAILSLSKDLDVRLGNALSGLLNIFGDLFRNLADLVDVLDDLGAKQLPSFAQGAKGGLLAIGILFQSVVVGFATLAGLLGVSIGLVLQLAAAAGAVDQSVADDALAITTGLVEAQNKLGGSLQNTISKFGELTTEIQASGISSKEAADGLRQLGDTADITALRLQQAIQNARKASTFDLTQAGPKTAQALTPQQLTAIANAQKKILAIANSLTLAEQKRIDPLNAQLLTLSRQVKELRKLAAVGGETQAFFTAMTAIHERTNAIFSEQARNSKRIADGLLLAAVQFTELAKFSPKLAADLLKAAEAAERLGGAKGADALEKATDKAADDLATELERKLAKVGAIGEDVAQGITQPLGAELRGVLEGEAFNFADVLAEASANNLQTAFDAVTAELSTAVGKIFQEQFGTDVFGSAAFSAALGAGLGLLAGAFSSTESKVRNDLAKSGAVQDVQATRGIVAGPTNVPIFQLGETIETAFLPTNALLTEIRNGIFALIGQPLATPGDDASTQELLRTTPSLL